MMDKTAIRAVVAALACTLARSALVGAAETVDLLCTRDTAIYSFSQIIGGVETGYINNSAGAAMGLFAGCNASSTPDNPNLRRALVHFDLSELPPNVQIQSVTLSLSLDRTSDDQPRPVSVHRLLADWGEGLAGAGGTPGSGGGGGQGSAAQQDDATWLYRFWDASLGPAGQAQNPLIWSTPGGDYVPTPSATAVVGIGQNAVCRYAWFDDVPADPQFSLKSDVERWLATPAENFGWIVIGDEVQTHTARRFQSRENDTTLIGQPTMNVNGVSTGVLSYEDFRPYLQVVYALDSDDDGVIDDLDVCPQTVAMSPVDAVGCPPVIPADFDRNGAVDDADLAHFIDCLSAPGIPTDAPACLDARLDGDEDADLGDCSVLQRCWSGSAPADPFCAS